jgi:hypothetical protein
LLFDDWCLAPRSGARHALGSAVEVTLRARRCRSKLAAVDLDLDDYSRIMLKLLEIHDDVLAIKHLLEDEDDGEPEDEDPGS